MELMAWPHWLIVAGALLVVTDIVGLALTRRETAEIDPPSIPEETTAEPRRPMPPLPKLLDSDRTRSEVRLEKNGPPA